MTESNTGSDIGPNASKKKAPTLIKSYGSDEVRVMSPAETPRERMIRVIRSVRRRKQK